MQIEIENDLSEMAKVREAVQQFSRKHHLNEEIIFVIDLCLEEFITNIIKYGYADQNRHVIQIRASLNDNCLLLEIRDDGQEFDPTKIPEPNLDAPLEERKIGGLGIHLVRNYVNSMEYRREDGKNVITLKKDIFL
jgi:anti-sigma regulatory factor (Ser/Thr protein kinase)